MILKKLQFCLQLQSCYFLESLHGSNCNCSENCSVKICGVTACNCITTAIADDHRHSYCDHMQLGLQFKILSKPNRKTSIFIKGEKSNFDNICRTQNLEQPVNHPSSRKKTKNKREMPW